MAIAVKICGLNSETALDAALDAGADFVGFVFFPPSPRNLDLPRVRALGARVAGRAGKVALTVDGDDGLLKAIIDALDPDVLQLHGHESLERVGEVKAAFGRPVMKVLPVADAGDLAPIKVYAGIADRLLFDARPPKNATRPGGLGKSFDWQLLRGIDPGIPFMVSGGLNADNVADALSVTRAPGVDVSSGVERVPGEKDPDKIRAFIRAVRYAEHDAGRRTIASNA